MATVSTEEFVALDNELETWLELELATKSLLSELDTLEELRKDDELTLDELTRDELLTATLEELVIIITVELCELDSKLLLELFDEPIEETIEEIAAELLEDELEVSEELLLTLDDGNELLLDVVPLLLDESEVESPPPQPANTSIKGNKINFTFSNLKMDRLTT